MSEKSPFYIIQEFVSPLLCEELIDLCNFNVPDADKDGKDILTVCSSESAESIVYDRLLTILPDLQEYYQLTYKGTEPVKFEWYPEQAKGDFNCENSQYLRGKWLRTKQRDLTAILFMSDYQEQLPFEQDYEVYGGKLEFPQHNFSFQPQRGTLVVFPSDPHFINVTSSIFAGELFQARMQIAAKVPYLYQPSSFPGNFTTWFKSIK